MGIRMIATKDMTYSTRRLKAGDEIEGVSGPNARLLTALGRAKIEEEKPKARRPQLDHDENGREGGAKKHSGDDLAALRDQYAVKFGKRAFNGWNADELRKRLSATD